MNQQDLLLELVKVRIKKFLFKYRTDYQSGVYIKCGRGANPQEFQKLVDELVHEGFVAVTRGERNSLVLNWIDKEAQSA